MVFKSIDDRSALRHHQRTCTMISTVCIYFAIHRKAIHRVESCGKTLLNSIEMFYICLLTVCARMGTGTQKYVHSKCLRRWQDSVQRLVQWRDKIDGTSLLITSLEASPRIVFMPDLSTRISL